MRVMPVFILVLFMGCSPSAQNEVVEQAPSTDPGSTADSQAPAPATSTITGIDVSEYQGTVDYAKVKAAGTTFVFVKATQGITYQDPNYQTNMDGARAAGLTAGAYHFYMTDDDPDDQFKNFSEHVQLQTGDLPPVVDIESLASNSLPNLADNLQKFLDDLQSHYGVQPIIYTGENFANEYLTGFGKYALWLAEYGVEKPTVPEGWTTWTFWQWTQNGSVGGVDGAVDQDRFNGSEENFEKLLIQ